MHKFAGAGLKPAPAFFNILLANLDRVDRALISRFLDIAGGPGLGHDMSYTVALNLKDFRANLFAQAAANTR